MRATRRWLAALLLVLGIAPGAERVLLGHAHPAAGPVAQLFATHEGAAAGLSGCAACQARATLAAIAVDAHPERHGVAPAARPEARPSAAPDARPPDTPRARAPPLLRIV